MNNNQMLKQLMKKFKKMDLSLVVNVYIIFFLSITFVYSATIYKATEDEINSYKIFRGTIEEAVKEYEDAAIDLSLQEYIENAKDKRAVIDYSEKEKALRDKLQIKNKVITGFTILKGLKKDDYNQFVARILAVDKRIKKVEKGLTISSINVSESAMKSRENILTLKKLLGKNKENYFSKQVKWGIIGTFVFLFFCFLDYRSYAKYSKVIYFINIVLLILVYILGKKVLGATRWIDLGFISFQPSELSKIFLVLTFGELLVNRHKDGIRGWSGIIKTGVHFIIPFLLILKQPDLGTSLVLIFIYYILIFMHGVDYLQYFSLWAANILLSPVAFMFLKDYQKARLTVFINPTADLLGDGWHIVQSIIAVGSGGMFGKGLFNGTQNKLKFLPESHTDFIFSVLAEETGFVGCVFLVMLYFWLIYQIIMIAKKSEDKYGQLICIGVATIIFFHTFINIGMVIGIMPVTGIPLLLMSYGGSQVLFMMMMLGIVQSVKIYGNT